MPSCSICKTDTSRKCPACLKNGIDSFFCEPCFKANWASHKLTHTVSFNPFPNYPYTGKLRPVYPLSPKRAVPAHIKRPDYADSATGSPLSELKQRGSNVVEIVTGDDLLKMRDICRISREVLEIGRAAAKVGVTTDEIDRVVHEACIERDAYPSPLNYYNFPKSCCTSVNEVICHGIPDRYEIQDGDIVNIDVSCFKDGFHADLNATYLVGNVDPAGVKLVETTRQCLDNAIAACKPGFLYRDLGNIIEKTAGGAGFSVVRTYQGHGVGRLFHGPPSVPHYAKNKAVGAMKPGHIFTIEPMINEGRWNDEQWPDRWTAVTSDGRRSAQFEETLLITEDGVEVLTGIDKIST